MIPEHRQLPYDVRFDWGLTGAGAAAADSPAGKVDVAVVIDVLSFTTTLSVAIDAGIEVLPYPSHDDSALRYATDNNADLAVTRNAYTFGSVSLSPSTIRSAQSVTRLVLPSPNGSTISYALRSTAGLCVGASLRNARATAVWIAQSYPHSAVVSVIAAGERWPDGTLRPSIEDLWGAGAVIGHLIDMSPTRSPSPEAEVAAQAWRSIAGQASSALHRSASGQELIAAGYVQDVEIAAEVDQSQSVPVLTGDHFRDARHLDHQLGYQA